MKGRVQYNWSPYFNQFVLAAYQISNIIDNFTKEATVIRRSPVLSLPLQFLQQDRAVSQLSAEMRFKYPLWFFSNSHEDTELIE